MGATSDLKLIVWCMMPIIRLPISLWMHLLWIILPHFAHNTYIHTEIQKERPVYLIWYWKQQRYMSRKGHHNNVINLSLQEKREREIVIESWWMQYEFTSYLFSIDTEHFNHTCKHCSNDILKWKTEKRSLSSCFPERTKQTHTQRISTNNGQLIQ